MLNGKLELSPEGKFVKDQFASSDGKAKIIAAPEGRGFLLDIATRGLAVIHDPAGYISKL